MPTGQKPTTDSDSTSDDEGIRLIVSSPSQHHGQSSVETPEEVYPAEDRIPNDAEPTKKKENTKNSIDAEYAFDQYITIPPDKSFAAAPENVCDENAEPVSMSPLHVLQQTDNEQYDTERGNTLQDLEEEEEEERPGAYAIPGNTIPFDDDDDEETLDGGSNEGDVVLQATLVDEHAQEEDIENRVREEVSRREHAAAQNIIQASILVEEENVPGKKKTVYGAVVVCTLVLVVALVSGLILRNTGDGSPQIVEDDDPTATEPPTPAPTRPYTWKLVRELNSTEPSGDRFGASVDINADGSVVAIGAPYPPFDPDTTGYVAVYESDGEGDWKLRGGRIDAPEAAKKADRGAEFGRGVSLSEDGKTVLILSTSLIGFYQYNHGNWILNRTFNVPNVTRGDIFNSACLSGSGEYVAIASKIANVDHMQIYGVADSSDADREEDISFTETTWMFGTALDISSEGNTVVIGGGKFAMVYKFGFFDWRIKQRFDEDANQVSLSSDGNILAIGSPHGAGNSGLVTTYRYVMNSANWTKFGSTIRGGPGENWGKRSMSLSGDGTAIAVTSLDVSDFSAGSLRLLKYREDIDNWEEFDSPLGHADPDFSPFFCAISQDGNTFVCSDTWGSHSGFARVYQLGRW